MCPQTRNEYLEKRLLELEQTVATLIVGKEVEARGGKFDPRVQHAALRRKIKGLEESEAHLLATKASLFEQLNACAIARNAYKHKSDRLEAELADAELKLVAAINENSNAIHAAQTHASNNKILKRENATHLETIDKQRVLINSLLDRINMVRNLLGDESDS